MEQNWTQQKQNTHAQRSEIAGQSVAHHRLYFGVPLRIGLPDRGRHCELDEAPEHGTLPLCGDGLAAKHPVVDIRGVEPENVLELVQLPLVHGWYAGVREGAE